MSSYEHICHGRTRLHSAASARSSFLGNRCRILFKNLSSKSCCHFCDPRPLSSAAKLVADGRSGISKPSKSSCSDANLFLEKNVKLLLSRCPLQPHEKYHDATIQTWSEHLWLQHVAPCDLEKTRVGSISAS